MLVAVPPNCWFPGLSSRQIVMAITA